MEKDTTRLTLQIGENTTTWETPYSDCNVEDILWGLYGLMTGQTFIPTSIIEGMKDFVEEHSDYQFYVPEPETEKHPE